MRVLHGDALEQMATLESGSVDAVLCDPPYGTTQCAWDDVIPFGPMWEALRRVCKPGAPMIFTASMPFTAALVMSNPSNFRHHWVWEKNTATGHLNAKRAPMRAHEDVLVFCGKAPAYNPQMTEGHKPRSSSSQGKNSGLYGVQSGAITGGGGTIRYPRTVQRFNVIDNKVAARVHPAQKPVDLLAYLLRTYTRPKDVVLDFACGSGSTGDACRKEGRQFIGIETDLAFAEHARRRIGALNQEIAA